MRILLWTFACNAQGVYADGWLGRKAHFMFAQGLTANSVQFTLELPEDKRIVPNRVTVSANGVTFLQQAINASGHHELVVPYDPEYQLPMEVTLTFARALPYDCQLRRLVCRLRNCEVIMMHS